MGSDASTRRELFLFASHSLMSNLIGKDGLVFCSDEIRKLDLSGNQMIVMGIAGKQ